MSIDSSARKWAINISCPVTFYMYSSTLDSQGLRIVLKALSASQEQLYEFLWKRFIGYKITDEAYHLPFSLATAPNLAENHTFLIEPSSWLAEIREKNGLLDIDEPDVKHFAIATADFWIEVLSSFEPTIVELAP